MAHSSIVIGTLLSMVVIGCAGPATEMGVALTDSAGSSSSAARFSGTWHGSFYELGQPPGGGAVGNIVLVINNDQTFTETLTGRGARTMSGAIVAQEDSVVLQNSSGGSVTLTLNRKDCTLHAVTRFLIDGRVVAVQLEKTEPTGDRETASATLAPSPGRRC